MWDGVSFFYYYYFFICNKKVSFLLSTPPDPLCLLMNSERTSLLKLPAAVSPFSTEHHRTMAPLGMVSMLGWHSSPEVGIISLIAFLVLSIVLVAICTQCHR